MVYGFDENKEKVELPTFSELYRELVKNTNEYTALSFFKEKIKIHYFKKTWTLNFGSSGGSVQKRMDLPSQYFPWAAAALENVAMFTQIVRDARDSTPINGIIAEPTFTTSGDNTKRQILFDFYCEEPNATAEVTIDILLIDMRAVYE